MMEKYFVITKRPAGNSHINEQDLLPASCKLITGVAVNAIVKKDAELEDVTQQLPFPQRLISDLLYYESIDDLFYSFLRTRSSEDESRIYFENDMLTEIIQVLSENIIYTCLDEAQQEQLEQNIINTFGSEFTDYLYNDVNLYEKGKIMSNLDFEDFIKLQTLIFAWLKREDMFFCVKHEYERPKAYECGNISLLVNGNSFLLRDYMVTANRNVRNMEKEIIPFHEPLEVNSNIHTVFKSNKNSDNTLTLRIYIQYETLSKREKTPSKPQR